MPPPHEMPIDITKLLSASARYLSRCFLSNQSLFSIPQGHPHRTTFKFSATLLLSQLGGVMVVLPSKLRLSQQLRDRRSGGKLHLSERVAAQEKEMIGRGRDAS
jgi:hypothetical protein